MTVARTRGHAVRVWPTAHISTVSKYKGDPKILKRGPNFEQKGDLKFNVFIIVHQERLCLCWGYLIKAVFACQTLRAIVFEILIPRAFQKYIICLAFLTISIYV